MNELSTMLRKTKPSSGGAPPASGIGTCHSRHAGREDRCASPEQGGANPEHVGGREDHEGVKEDPGVGVAVSITMMESGTASVGPKSDTWARERAQRPRRRGASEWQTAEDREHRPAESGDLPATEHERQARRERAYYEHREQAEGAHPAEHPARAGSRL